MDFARISNPSSIGKQCLCLQDCNNNDGVQDTDSGKGSDEKGMATAAGQRMKAQAGWGDYVPVYVAVGMIAVAVGLGAHTMKQQLMHAPAVTLRKSKRGALPELVEPEQAVEESDNLVRKSFFRKIAHVQGHEVPSLVPDSIRGDVFSRKPKAEMLKDVGVDPKP